MNASTLWGPFDMQAAARLTHIPRGTIDAWERAGLVRASVKKGRGRGHARAWSLGDILQLRLAAELRDKGLPIRTIRRLLRMSQQQGWWQTSTMPKVEAAPCSCAAAPIAVITGRRWETVTMKSAAEVAAEVVSAIEPVLSFNLERLREQWLVELRPVVAELFVEALGLRGEAAREKARELTMQQP